MRNLILAALSLPLLTAQENRNPDPAFFESRVRPVLAAKCYACHGPQRQFSDLRLDTPEGIKKGGQRGPTAETLLPAVQHAGAVKMPPGGKLSPSEIDALEKWVAQGLPWPNAQPAATKEKPHWAFQPLQPAPGKTIDQFFSQKSPAAGKRTLARRAAYAVTGMPPQPELLAKYLDDDSPNAWPSYVDALLASPRYGERWARHWMDLMRYAETYGYEWNYEIQGAWRYRDYLIRAFNIDLPFNQFVREHVAGDLLATPRISNHQNESALATAFWRFGEMGHDNCNQFRELRTDVVDNQIDTLTKAFQGVTVSCARCHDHKFDPIPTADYYALYGIINSSRPIARTLNQAAAPDLKANKAEVRRELARLWLAESAALSGKKLPAVPQLPSPSVDFRHGLPAGWSATGLGFTPVRAGDFALAAEGGAAVETIFPDGLATNATTSRWNGSLRSPILPRDKKFLTLQASAANAAAHRTIMDNCVIGEDYKLIEPAGMHLEKVPTRNDQPLPTFLELNTITDNPRIPDRPGRLKPAPPETQTRSWFVVTQGWYHNEEDAPKPPAAEVDAASVLPAAIERWAQGIASDGDVHYLNAALTAKLLSNKRDATPALDAAVGRYRALETALPAPSVTSSLADVDPGSDYPVLLSGQALNPGRLAPRHFLSLLPESLRPVNTQTSGRLEMAEAIANPLNPLTARVYVNRVWHHVFGKGIVASTDNFGKLGDAPVSQELLDTLADRFMKSGWSTKTLIRQMLLSDAFRAEGQLRRLDAESVRDTLLAVSGRLDETMFGPSIQPYRKEPVEHRRLFQGPLDGNGRRSIYLKITRMQGPKFLEIFDFPGPLQCRGNRDVTNVPTQALAMLNDPFVLQQAKVWAEKLVSRKDDTVDARLTAMFNAALGRPPSPTELGGYKALAASLGEVSLDNLALWQQLAHTLFNSKEFLYLP
ncbi:MAG TPA: PSD1 and planctomycete cytochrome C domain-containing protein [Bryobacteraceae bacterium]|nr:PSD1 and planctomycete cytochrome C domain-containing protein [Bryobacteraceae bacterium]